MALIFCDGFDYYGTNELTRKWTSRVGTGNAISPDGRGGRNSFRVTGSSNYVSRTFNSADTVLAGFAFRKSGTPSAANSILCQFLDGATIHVDVRVQVSSNALVVTRNGTVLATSVNALADNTWYYIEFKTTISDTGTYEVRVNGTSSGWIPPASGDTRNGATASANVIRLGNIATTTGIVPIDFDDFYLLNGIDGTATQGSPFNDFLGDTAVEWLPVTGTVSNVGYTPATNPHLQLNEASDDSDTTFAEATNAGSKLVLNLAMPQGSQPVHAVQLVGTQRKTDAGSKVTKLGLADGTSTTWGPDYGVTDSYSSDLVIVGKQPTTGNPLARADFPLQIAHEVVS
jgi:hypothetical protein